MRSDLPLRPDLRQSLCHTLLASSFVLLGVLNPFTPGGIEPYGIFISALFGLDLCITVSICNSIAVSAPAGCRDRFELAFGTPGEIEMIPPATRSIFPPLLTTPSTLLTTLIARSDVDMVLSFISVDVTVSSAILVESIALSARSPVLTSPSNIFLFSADFS